MLRDLEEFVFEILRQLHPDAEIIHRGFAFGHLLALCYPPRSTGQVHHFDLVGGGAYVLTLGLVPEGSSDGQEGTCVLELEETDRQLLSRCSEQAFHTFMLAWGSHMQANASNAFGALEDFCSNKGKAHVGLLRAWTGWLLSDGPLGVPLVDEADKRFKPLSGHVDAGVGMMIPNVWHKGGSNNSDRWRVVAFLFVGSEMAGQYSFSEQWNSIVILAWAYGELSPVVVSQAVQWELCMGVRVCASLTQPEDGARGKPREFLLGWYLQQCRHLAMLLLGCSPKELLPPCSTAQQSAGAVTRELVRLAPPGGDGCDRDFVIPKPKDGVECCSSVPYTTRIREWGCMERQRCGVVDKVVRMFMRVVVGCCMGDVSEPVVEPVAVGRFTKVYPCKNFLQRQKTKHPRGMYLGMGMCGTVGRNGRV